MEFFSENSTFLTFLVIAVPQHLISFYDFYLSINNSNKLIASRDIRLISLNKKSIKIKKLMDYSNLVQLLISDEPRVLLVCMTKNGLHLKLRSKDNNRKKQCAWLFQQDISFISGRTVYYRLRSYRWKNYICVNRKGRVFSCAFNQFNENSLRYRRVSLFKGIKKWIHSTNGFIKTLLKYLIQCFLWKNRK